MKSKRLFLVFTGFLHASGVHAGGEIRLDHSSAVGWTLEVKQSPLSQVFQVISEKMGVPLVSPQPPEGALTLRCSGADVSELLRCLLGSGASVMYRRGLPGRPEAIASVRILASSFVGSSARRSGSNEAVVASLLEMTRSEDPDTRADGYTRLSQLAAGNETIQRGAFHQGLSDPSGEVRAAALLGLHGVDPEGSRDDLVNGLKDVDGNVRLAALDIMGTGPGAEVLLKQAMNDPDDLVRELARMRLGLPEQNTQAE